MRKKKLSFLSLVLAIVMVASALASCGGGGEAQTTEKPDKVTTEAPAGDTTEKPTESPVDDTTEAPDAVTTEGTKEETTEVVTEPTVEEIKLEGEHAAIIENANSLANALQSYYSDDTHKAFTIVNTNMSMEYGMNPTLGQQLNYLKNTKGKSYIENTMDVFVKMTDGSVLFASASSIKAVPNVYRLGYYYQEARFEGQVFLNARTVPIMLVNYNCVENVSTSNDVLNFTVADAHDPYIEFKRFSYNTDEGVYVRFSLKAPASAGLRGEVFVMNNDDAYYSVNGVTKNIKFDIESDGEYHTYAIKLSDLKGYEGTVTGFRFDVEGAAAGDSFELKNIEFVKTEDEPSQATASLSSISTARVFHAYSDKLHHELQVAATSLTSGIAEIGMVTEIKADSVDKIIVKDISGHHDSLEGVDWTTAEYIGFDIKGVGIFGYIMPVSPLAGQMTVTIEDGVYIITQSREVENNTILPVEGSCEDMVGKAGNTNDFYMGQRLYTDENHDFDAFLKEAYIERNPLTQKNIKVSEAYSDMGRLVGYDPIRGAYEFYVRGSDFNEAYYVYPNRHYRLNFTIMGDEHERNIYILAATPAGSLETAALLDEGLMMLPIPIEVCKNFGSDEISWPNVHDAFDLAYGEAIFPLLLTPGELREYNLLHIYQNWGKFPIKQISSIEYIAPYYHMSVGVTESNCLVPWGWMDTGIENILPDHRGVSAPLWEHQPQHEAAGEHRSTKYTHTVTGATVDPELVHQHIDAYGPNYLDLVSVYEADDGIFTLTTNYVEMPQLDENRAYYSMEYVFKKDATFTDFKRQFSFYAMSDKWSISYNQLGYLDENNECVVVDTDNKESHKMFVLGDQSPYFSYFNSYTDGIYCNLSYLIRDYSIVIDGQETDTHFAIRKNKSWIYLTLDLDEVTFKAGDKISFNAIILPWGSEESDYSGTNYAPDQNVRDVRADSCLNPVVAKAGEGSETIESSFVPRVRSLNGKSAEFTLSGGAVSAYEIPYRDKGHNITVRVYGFDTLTVPKVYEKIDGEWVAYELSSATSLDKNGFGAYYDGYSVYYDGDGTYSFAFVVDMSEAKDRTFKVELDESFEGWARIEGVEVAPDPTDIYLDPLEIKAKAGGVAPWFTSMDLMEDAGVSYINFTANPENKYGRDANFMCIENNEIVSGQYLIIKYRSNAEYNRLQFYASTTNGTISGNDGCAIPEELYMRDGEWHILIVDLSKLIRSYTENENGEFVVKYLRFDVFNFDEGMCNSEHYVDVAFLGMSPDLELLTNLDNTTGTIYMYDGNIHILEPAK